MPDGRKGALSDRLLEALQTLARLSAPSLQELADAMGVSYTAAASYQHQLQVAGMVVRTPGRARSLVVTERGKRALRKAR